MGRLGELSTDHMRERSSRNKRVLDPGTHVISDWENRYTSALYPFTIGTSAERILPANPLRTYLLIQNKSGGTIFVNFGQNPTVFASVGIFAGGNYELQGGATGGAFSPQDDIYILGSAAGLAGVAVEGIWTPKARSLR